MRAIQKRDKKTGRIAVVHGGFGTVEYEAWRAMMKRCYCETNASYDNYGGRGISVCRRWANFKNFLKDVGYRPSPDHSLGRINNEGNYTPKNCRWETRRQQQGNRRSVRLITHNGLTMPMAHWAELTGLHRTTLRQRLFVFGWSVADALTRTPR